MKHSNIHRKISCKLLAVECTDLFDSASASRLVLLGYMYTGWYVASTIGGGKGGNSGHSIF